MEGPLMTPSQEGIGHPESSPTNRRRPLEKHGVSCRLCLDEIRGVRWTCINCPCWSVCSGCFDTAADLDVHPSHTFVKIHWAGDVFSTSPSAAQTMPAIHLDVSCKSCGGTVVGALYQCAVQECQDKGGYTICQDCEALPIDVHPASHPLIKYKLPVGLCRAAVCGPSEKQAGKFDSDTKQRFRFLNANGQIRSVVDLSASSGHDAASSDQQRVPSPLQVDYVCDGEKPWGSIVRPLETFTKSWHVVNVGSRPWPKGLSLQRTSRAQFSPAGSDRILLHRMPLMSGGRYEVKIHELMAPKLPGTYVETWRIVDETGWPMAGPAGISGNEAAAFEIRLAVAEKETPAELADVHGGDRFYGLSDQHRRVVVQTEPGNDVAGTPDADLLQLTKGEEEPHAAATDWNERVLKSRARRQQPGVKVLATRIEWSTTAEDQEPAFDYGQLFAFRWLVVNDGVEPWPPTTQLQCQSRNASFMGWIVDDTHAQGECVQGGLIGSEKQSAWICLKGLRGPRSPKSAQKTRTRDEIERELASYAEMWSVVNLDNNEALPGDLVLKLPGDERCVRRVLCDDGSLDEEKERAEGRDNVDNVDFQTTLCCPLRRDFSPIQQESKYTSKGKGRDTGSKVHIIEQRWLAHNQGHSYCLARPPDSSQPTEKKRFVIEEDEEYEEAAEEEKDGGGGEVEGKGNNQDRDRSSELQSPQTLWGGEACTYAEVPCTTAPPCEGRIGSEEDGGQSGERASPVRSMVTTLQLDDGDSNHESEFSYVLLDDSERVEG